MVSRLYYVYLTDNNDTADPEEGTEHEDWIRFVCKSADVGFQNNNDVQRLPDHEGFEIKLGDIVFKVRLNDSLFMRMNTSANGETSWNKFVEFVGKHAMSDGQIIYLMVYGRLGSDSTNAWMKFFDNGGTMRDWMKCRVKSFRFKISAVEQTAVGSLELEEVWT